MQTALTSAKNPLLKDVRRAVARGVLTEDGCCVAETFHLLEEALRSNCEVKAVLVAESVQSAVDNHVRGLKQVRVIVVADALFNTISTTESSQGVIALVRPPVWTLDQLFRGKALVVVLDGIQDPGNAGAIVRSAEAFGATGVIFVKGTVSPHNPKSLRASAGSLFRVPLVCGMDEELTRVSLAQRRIEAYAAAPRGNRNLPDIDLTRPCALVIGSEGRGVSEKLRAACSDLRIPTLGVESLNASAAASILLY
jgi:TrmH family RNA methyltransferase